MPNKNEKLKEARLRAVLSEYAALRREATDAIRFQLQVLIFAPTAISAILGFIFVYQVYEAILVIPFITIALAYRWIWDVQIVVVYNGYLLEMEENKIPELIDFFDATREDYLKYWVGWQHYYDETRFQRTPTWAYAVALFLGIPTIFSIGYLFINGLASANLLYILAAVIYFLLCMDIARIMIGIWKDRISRVLESIFVCARIKN